MSFRTLTDFLCLPGGVGGTVTSEDPVATQQRVPKRTAETNREEIPPLGISKVYVARVRRYALCAKP